MRRFFTTSKTLATLFPLRPLRSLWFKTLLLMEWIINR